MKRFASVLRPALAASAAAVLLCAAPALAGDAPATETLEAVETSDAPEASEGMSAEGMSPEQKAMMQAGEARWAANATPGKAHENLAKLAGEWDATIRISMGPGTGEWMESQGSATFKMILGGRYLKQSFKCLMEMPGEEPMPFEGLGLTGYNNRTGQYESTWMDNTGTAINVSKSPEGTDPDDEESAATGTYYDPFMDLETQSKEVSRWVDDNTHQFDYNALMPDGSWWHLMSITYKRK
jgi:hypothetical protein